MAIKRIQATAKEQASASSATSSTREDRQVEDQTAARDVFGISPQSTPQVGPAKPAWSPAEGAIDIGGDGIADIYVIDPDGDGIADITSAEPSKPEPSKPMEKASM